MKWTPPQKNKKKKRSDLGLIGIVCGLKSEQSALGPFARHVRVRSRVSGADAGRAGEAADALVELGARVLVSFGVSGGLDPALGPGTVVLARSVEQEGRQYPASISLLSNLQARAVSEDVSFEVGPIVGSDTLASDAKAKAALATAHGGALAVDMESHAVARVAEREGLAFLAIRVIADPAHRALPASAEGAVAPDGSIRVGNVLAASMGSPRDLWQLIQVGRDSARAHKALRRSARHFVPALLGIVHVG